MTKVKITKQNNFITVVEASGHTGYKESGEDIVCAALSSIIQTAALGVVSVAKVDAKIEKDDKLGYFKIIMPNKITKKQLYEANIILNTMLNGVNDLLKGYSNFIELEVLDDVY